MSRGDWRPPWPTERAWVTAAIYSMAMVMLLMAYFDPGLWDVELFKVLIQAVIISGLINMVLAFHFAANKSDETKAENTKAAFRAIEAAAKRNEKPEQ